MEQNNYKNDLPIAPKSIIKVIGVGGGGSNAVNYMFNRGIRDVEFIVCNTDVQALNMSAVPTKLQIGINLTEGLGAGANPDVGKDAAVESRDQIRELLSHNTKMLFVTAGMGGGTGTGAAPVIAETARELGILTVAIVTAPFAFEGPKKRKHAVAGIEQLKDYCDAILVIPNDKLREIYGNLKMSEAFAQADNVLTMAAKGIAEIITVPGVINVDFEDVKTVMKGAGAVVMGSAKTEGDDRALRAAQEALNSPLLNTKDIHGAQKILLSVIHGDKNEPQMDELMQIADYIQEKVGEDAEMIFGTAVDPTLGTGIRVTIIAAGFTDTLIESLEKKPKAQVESQFINTSNTYKNQGNLSKEFASILENKADNQPKPTTLQPEQKTEKESAQNNINDRKIVFEVNSKPNPQPYFNSTQTEKESNIITNTDEAREEKIIYDLDDELRDRFDTSSLPSNYETKKEELLKQTNERIDKLRRLSRNFESENNYKDKIEIPAYLRRNIKLEDEDNTPEEDSIKFNLDDDKPYPSHNKFFPDSSE